MAWTASGWYVDTLKLEFIEDITFDLELDTHKVALYNNTLTPNFAASAPAYSTTNEITGTGYTAGGSVIANTTVAVSGAYVVWDGDDITWTSSTLTGVRGANAYADSLAGNNLILGISFGTDYATNDGSLLLSFNASGIGRIT